MDKSDRHRWRVKVNGEPVVGDDAPSEDEAVREATRYAMRYAKDGGVIKATVTLARKTVFTLTLQFSTTYSLAEAAASLSQQDQQENTR